MSAGGGVRLDGSTETRTTSYGSVANGSSKPANTVATSTHGTSLSSRPAFNPNAYRKGSPSAAGSASTSKQGAGARNFAKVKPVCSRLQHHFEIHILIGE